ncbi:MAG: hypothetical protein ACK56T_05155, partial [Dolichospermum sp.]
QVTGNTGRKTELIPTESCMATPRKLSKIKYYSYIDEANYPLPITNYQLSITNYPLPITNYPLPITHYQLPITNYPLPITHYPLPIINLNHFPEQKLKLV